jgi:hypothetical protein
MVTAEKAIDGSRPTGAPKIPDTRDWLTRNEATDMLSCALQTLVNYERKGVLNPEQAYRPDARGVEHRVVVYNPHELKKVANRLNRHAASPRDPGEVTARAYDLFEEGKPPKEIVRELRITSDAVRELREKWKDDGGADLVICSTAKEALEKVVGSFDSVTELVERVARLKAP